ncbi:MAG: septum formation initiator family protein [Acidimicrobiia bacterium]|nr:septum formation initiator family protein [Acidimicrobiia bacterium]
MSAHKPPRFFRRLSLLMVGAVSSLALIYAIIGNNGYLELRRRETVNRELRAKADRLRRENSHLLHEIKALKSDPKTIEKIAREELGMVKPGDVKIMTSPDRQVPAPADRK